jgi:hypothetical protein
MQTEKIFGRKGSEKKTVPLGVLVTKKVYITDRRPEHYFRNYDGFGLSNSLLVQLHGEDTDEINFQYYDVEGLIVYLIRLDDFIAYGVEVDFGDKQTVCPLKYMRILKKLPVESKKVITDGKQ